jgi:DNA-binding CsgD family transcriptional regulator
MLSGDGFLRDTLETPDGASAGTPSNETGPTSPTREQVEGLRQGCAAVERALESIAAPAFVVDVSGAVQHANALGRIALARDPVHVAASLAAAVAAAKPTRDWSLTPLSRAGHPALQLAIMQRARPRPSDDIGPYRAARLRWGLTARQAQVLELVARGLTNALVAETLGISVGTVEYHLTALFDKAGVFNRATLIVRMLELARR